MNTSLPKRVYLHSSDTSSFIDFYFQLHDRTLHMEMENHEVSICAENDWLSRLHILYVSHLEPCRTKMVKVIDDVYILNDWLKNIVLRYARELETSPLSVITLCSRLLNGGGVSLACHSPYDTGPRFTRCHPKDRPFIRTNQWYWGRILNQGLMENWFILI